jgi:hypothetical protein
VVKDNKALCKGHGTTSESQPFLYDNELVLKNNKIEESFKVIYPQCKELSGSMLYHKVDLKKYWQQQNENIR